MIRTRALALGATVLAATAALASPVSAAVAPRSHAPIMRNASAIGSLALVGNGTALAATPIVHANVLLPAGSYTITYINVVQCHGQLAASTSLVVRFTARAGKRVQLAKPAEPP